MGEKESKDTFLHDSCQLSTTPLPITKRTVRLLELSYWKSQAQPQEIKYFHLVIVNFMSHLNQDTRVARFLVKPYFWVYL